MEIIAVNAKDAIPERIHWNDQLLSTNKNVLLLGEGPALPIEIDISKNPHILVGGSTGSGKTVLIMCLVHQALRQGMNVLLGDFKGIDFSAAEWCSSSCKKIQTVEVLIEELKKALETIELRRGWFQVTGSSNLDEFNTTQNKYEQQCRYLIVIDEVAEILDTTGKTKEEKAQIAEIIAMLSTIARQGRAFGIHLLLGTQRPDANILPGQIKNNIDCRICGKADNVLSQIILDNTAATEIPKTSQGRFMMADGTIFQGYFYKP